MCALIRFSAFVIAVRVSGGHLCKAEAPSGCGNPLPFRGIRILSRFAFRMTSRLAIANTQGAQIYFRLPVIAVRVSGGHLCEAEAPTEPVGETTARCVAICSLLREIRIFSHIALSMTKSRSKRGKLNFRFI